jgi:hypothetical protein
MAETKLSKAKIPNMAPVEKPAKLGLLTPEKRRMVSFKLDPLTISNLLGLVTHYKESYFYGITKTDVLETALAEFLAQSQKKQLKLLQKYGLERK